MELRLEQGASLEPKRAEERGVSAALKSAQGQSLPVADALLTVLL